MGSSKPSMVKKADQVGKLLHELRPVVGACVDPAKDEKVRELCDPFKKVVIVSAFQCLFTQKNAEILASGKTPAGSEECQKMAEDIACELALQREKKKKH